MMGGMTAVLTHCALTDRLIQPDQVHEVLARSILVDGFDFVLDLTRSAGSYLVDARDGRRYLDMFTFFASSALGHEPSGAGRRRRIPRRTRRGRAEQAQQLRHLHGADGPLRRDLRPGAGRPGAAASVLRRRRRAGGGERAQGRVRLEEPAQRGPRHRPGARHPGAAPARGVPRPQRLHAVADQHRARQRGALPEIRLAAHRRAVHPAGPGRAGHARAGSRVAAPGPRGVRGVPARHRLLHRRADPGRGRRPALPARSSSRRCASCATSTTRC